MGGGDAEVGCCFGLLPVLFRPEHPQVVPPVLCGLP